MDSKLSKLSEQQRKAIYRDGTVKTIDDRRI